MSTSSSDKNQNPFSVSNVVRERNVQISLISQIYSEAGISSGDMFLTRPSRDAIISTHNPFRERHGQGSSISTRFDYSEGPISRRSSRTTNIRSETATRRIYDVNTEDYRSPISHHRERIIYNRANRADERISNTPYISSQRRQTQRYFNSPIDTQREVHTTSRSSIVIPTVRSEIHDLNFVQRPLEAFPPVADIILPEINWTGKNYINVGKSARSVKRQTVPNSDEIIQTKDSITRDLYDNINLDYEYEYDVKTNSDSEKAKETLWYSQIGQDLKSKLKKINSNKRKNGYDHVALNYEFHKLRESGQLKLIDEQNRKIAGKLSEFMSANEILSQTPQNYYDKIKNYELTEIPNLPSTWKENISKVRIFTKNYSHSLKLLEEEKIIGLDIEFCFRDPKYPAVIQISSFKYGTLIIHTETLTTNCILALKSLLENRKVLKIGFDVTNDSKCLKILQIYPIGFLDLQACIKSIMNSDEGLGLGSVVKLLLDTYHEKEGVNSLFEKRIHGILPHESIIYSACDAIFHLLSFYGFIEKLSNGLEGEALIERRSKILSEINDTYYYTRHKIAAPNVHINKNPTKEQDQENKFQTKSQSYWNLKNQQLVQKLDEYRKHLHLRYLQNSKFDFLPNWILFELANAKKIDKLDVKFLLESHRPKLHRCVRDNYKELYYLVVGKKTVQDLANHFCPSCKGTCPALSYCNNKKVDRKYQKRAQMNQHQKSKQNKKKNELKRLKRNANMIVRND